MTNEQAIENIQTIKELYTWSSGADEALEMAIQALQEQSGDAISREVFEQVIWERDVAIAEVKELGYRFGEKPPMGIWKVIEQEPAYCDRNICLKNEYSDIGCEDCEVTKSQEPCEYAISRQAVMNCFKKWQPYMATRLHEFEKELSKLPSVAIPTDHDGCKDCKHELKSDGEYPCSYCKQNYKDMWEREKPTDTITMTREEFSEKLMEHYRQGRADEKAYQNGEIMQSFNPD